MHLRQRSVALQSSLVLAILGCLGLTSCTEDVVSDGSGAEMGSGAEESSAGGPDLPSGDGGATTSGDGDGDGDATTSGDGDGDATTSGDGDGDATTSGDGDGDGDATTTGNGDGDGDATTTGDGDGDGDATTTGDGDGDGDGDGCVGAGQATCSGVCVDVGTGIRDENQTASDSELTTSVFGQRFVPTISGYLSAFVVREVSAGGVGTATMSLHIGGLCGNPSDACDVAVTTQSVALSDGTNLFVFDEPQSVVAGVSYVVRLETATPVSMQVATNDPYTAGSRLGGSPADDLNFATYIWGCGATDCVNVGDCSGNGVCSALDTCTCDAGWAPPSCATPICVTSCENGGVCVGPDTCDCTGTGYEGATCETPVCTTPCANGGVCDGPDSCDCTAAVGYTGATCETPVCTTPCANGGVCSAPDTCDCTGTGYDGATCETPVCSTPCANGGVCDGPDSCDCTAAVGYTGATCETPVCATPCENGGLCSAPDTCDCTGTGYEGATCADPACVFFPCQNGATCVGPEVCDCTGTGYDGPSCDDPVCTSACQNSGVCSAPDTCDCTGTGYDGAVCDNPICSLTCLNGGVCGSPDSCDCTGTGYTGDACELPVCTTPCANGGVCTAPDTCDCTAAVGYSGPTCETPVCNPACGPGGTCTAPDFCQCDAGYSGTTCETTTCGDTIPAGGETCDEGGDTTTCDGDCTAVQCGDGYWNTVVEQCDSGAVDTAGCNSGTCETSSCPDGYPNAAAGEACDDGNSDNTDTCTNTCTAAACGDGWVQSGEACDGDGAGIGGETAACNVDCTLAACGDDKVNASAGEDCDASGGADTATCNGNSALAIAAGVQCKTAACGDGYANASHVPTKTDGVTTQTTGEACDGGAADTDACNGNADDAVDADAACQVANCGDGYVNTAHFPGGQANAEVCDVGTADTAGCNADSASAMAADAACQVADCGDGYWNDQHVPPGQASAEGCDEGAADTASCNGDGASALAANAACQVAACGDSHHNAAASEPCDDGNNGDQDDGCVDGCALPSCGDGFAQDSGLPNAGIASEFCDGADLNTAACDTPTTLGPGWGGGTLGCNIDCTFDTSACYTCADGVADLFQDLTRTLTIDFGGSGYTPAAGDEFGAAIAAGDFNGDGYDDLAVGAPGINNDAGGVFIFDGAADGTFTYALRYEWGPWCSSSPDFRLGHALASGNFNGDVNVEGNPYDDLAFSALDPGDTFGAGGYVFVKSGSASGLPLGACSPFTDASGVGLSPQFGNDYGFALAVADTDVPADGYDDLYIGVPGYATNAGAIGWVQGSATGLFGGSTDVETENAYGGSASSGYRFGSAIAVSAQHLAIGSPGAQSGGGVAGAGRVFVGAPTVPPPPSTTFVLERGTPVASDNFGSAVAVGNLDDLNYDEVAAAGGLADVSGVADAGLLGYARGISGGVVTSLVEFSESDVDKMAVQAGDEFGSALIAGDFDGNGLSDLVTGIPGQQATFTATPQAGAGAIGLFVGTLASEGSLNPGGAFYQECFGEVSETDDAWGSALAAGDFNGDGADDLVVGAPNEGNASNVRSGSVSIRFGFPTANCGDGLVGASEACDNDVGDPPAGGDGCSATCTVEAGYVCAGQPNVCSLCGDGVIEGVEQCDDGGTSNDDGCASTCVEEAGWNCTGEGASTNCVAESCGDGIQAGAEACDDGGAIGGCNGSCTGVSSNWTCSGGINQLSVCNCVANYQDNDNNGTCNLACTGSYCNGNGTCSDADGSRGCTCFTGYTGSTCSSCASGYQDNDNNGTCNPSCTSTYCNSNGGNANGVCSDADGTRGCSCYEPYSGTTCSTWANTAEGCVQTDFENYSYLDWEDNIQPLMNTYCSGCHSGASAWTHANTVNVSSPDACYTNRVNPYDPTYSAWYRRMSGTACGTRMPDGGPYLLSTELATIRRWICTGAKATD